jgi:hypothetical protein
MNGLGEIDNFLAEKKADTQSRLRERGLSELRKRWEEAVADESDRLGPDPVFDRLEAKYANLAKANKQ